MRLIGIALFALTGCVNLSGGEGILGLCDSPTKGIASLKFTPNPISLKPNLSVYAEANPYGSDGLFVLCAPTPTWVIRDEAIATLTSSAFANAVTVRGVAVGSTYAIATAGGRSDSVAVLVVAP